MQVSVTEGCVDRVRFVRFYPLVDRDDYLTYRLADQPARNRSDPSKDEGYTVGKTIGVFLVSYKPEELVVIDPGDRILIVMKQYHVTRPLPTVSSGSASPDDPVVSYCFVHGIDQDNEISAGAVLLRPSDLFDFDLISMLNRSDYSLAMEPDREELIKRIEEMRRANTEDAVKP